MDRRYAPENRPELPAIEKEVKDDASPRQGGNDPQGFGLRFRQRVSGMSHPGLKDVLGRLYSVSFSISRQVISCILYTTLTAEESDLDRDIEIRVLNNAQLSAQRVCP